MENSAPSLKIFRTKISTSTLEIKIGGKTRFENLLKTIIPFALVGYEVIKLRYALVRYFITSYPTRAYGIIVIYLQIIPRVVRIRNTPLAKEREHLNGFE